MKRKKGGVIFSLFLFLSSLFSSCENPFIQQIVEPRTVTFESNGGSSVESQTVLKNQPIKRPENPSRDGCVFAAWCRDNETFLEEWDFDAAPNEDITLYAKWNAIPPTRMAAGIEVTTQPKLTYTHGDTLDLSGLVATLAYNVGSPEDVAFADFASRGITTSPEHGTPLVHLTHNDTPVAVSKDSFTDDTYALTVNPKAIAFDVDPIPSQEYDGGNPITPAVKVKDGAIKLTLNADYTVAYSNNTSVGNDAAVTIIGKGNYLGSSGSATFRITKKISGIEVTTQPKLSYTHGDPLDLSGLKVTFTYDDNSTEVVAFGDFGSRGITTSLADGIPLVHLMHDGASVTITYNNFSDTINLTVSQKTLTVTGAAHTKEYDGTTNANGVSVTLDGKAGSDEVSPGTVTAAYTSANAGTKTINITGVTLTGAASGNYTVTPKNNVIVAGIAKATPTITTLPTAVPITYGAALSASTLNGGAASVAGTFAWSDPSIMPPVNNSGYPVTFTPTDAYNYNLVASNVSITVNKAAGAGISTALNATDANIGVNSVTLTAVVIAAPVTGQTVEYGINTNYSPLTAKWQDSTIFTELSAGTTYYFYARSKENDNYEAGAETSTQIKTKQQQSINVVLDVDELIDELTDFNVNIIISRTGTGYPKTDSVAISGTYHSIHWEIPGVGVNAQSVTGTSATIELNAEEVKYNSPGWHRVNVTITKTAGGMEYMKSFMFRIVE